MPSPEHNSKSLLPLLVVGADARLLNWLGDMFADTLKSVPSWMQAIAEVSTKQYHLVLAGVSAEPDQNKLAIAGLRQADSNVRIILYCEPIREPLARQALTFGADDYLIEPLTKRQLLQSLNGQSSALLSSTSLPESGPTEPPQLNAPAKAIAPDDQISHATTDDYAFCEQLLRVGQLGTDQFVASLERLLTEKLAVQWAKLHLLTDQVPAKAPGKIFVEHGLDLARGERLLIQIGKPLSPETSSQSCLDFLERVSGVLKALFDVSRHTAALQKLAITDELTGLYNRRYVYEFTEQVLARAHGERFEVTVLLFDVDNFKHYNDTYGHATGDEVLRETADLMRRCSRDHDLVGRFGGDEFVMIFWDAEKRRTPDSRHPQTAFALSERFRRTVSEHNYKCLGPAAKGTLTISGGLASFPWDAATVDDLFARADDALLQAKASGKNLIYIVGQEG